MKTKPYISVCVFILFILISISVNAKIYKWTDKDGNVQYTQTPPPSSNKGSSREMDIHSKSTMPTGKMSSEFRTALRGGDYKKVVKLVNEKKGGVNSVDKYGDNALYHASRNRHYKIEKFLVEKGAKDVIDSRVAKALTQAVGYNRVESTNLLLSDITRIYSNYSRSEISKSLGFIVSKTTHKEDYDVLKLLLDKRAPTEYRRRDGKTALIGASRNGSTKVVKLLILAGAKINAQDKNGSTALIQATCCGNLKTVKVLVKNGANHLVRDRFGNSALDYAKKSKNTAVLNYLSTL